MLSRFVSFHGQSVFLSKAKIMYKIKTNLTLSYLNEMFLMRHANLDNTSSNLRSAANKNFIVPQAKCNLFKGSLSYSGMIANKYKGFFVITNVHK